ncbi:MAG: GNAT family N-acetyltransferase [Oligoflexia bacterium]|nr:GNAT family N-acetyltransferase [Oligoflexia bacterium]
MKPELHWESGIPSIETKRLVLRPFRLEDAKEVQRLAGHPRVAATTAAIPHPYPDGAAEEWISEHGAWYEERRSVTLAVELKAGGALIGCIDLLGVSANHARAEMGYWIGVDYWNQGYCTEAAAALVGYGFEQLGLNKVTARHIVFNPSSGKVMLKVGMKQEGLLREDFFRDGAFYDMCVYGITRADYAARGL